MAGSVLARPAQGGFEGLLLAQLACHSARRFGDHLEREEQVAILKGLDEIPWAPTCPHGRPVAASLPFPEIEKKFDRR